MTAGARAVNEYSHDNRFLHVEYHEPTRVVITVFVEINICKIPKRGVVVRSAADKVGLMCSVSVDPDHFCQ